MSLGWGDLLLLFLLLEGKPWAQETCHAKPCMAKRVSEQANPLAHPQANLQSK